MIDIRYCKKCKKAYDIDTSQELCPKCRRKIKSVKEKEKGWGRGYGY